MREYESREEAERDPELDLRIIWKCDKCGKTASSDYKPHATKYPEGMVV